MKSLIDFLTGKKVYVEAYEVKPEIARNNRNSSLSCFKGYVRTGIMLWLYEVMLSGTYKHVYIDGIELTDKLNYCEI